MIETKVKAAASASALVTIIVWLIQTATDITVPAEVAAAGATVVIFLVGYLTPTRGATSGGDTAEDPGSE
ncbi:hypothetical protein ACGFNU_01795 [Spirillospora sp. NPDC048911]|uniref:hypothetical protein n=1 Tax=Spirillospora sp. NPDC048911 TaxID=3364527 RepID=UPI00371E2401